MEHSKENPILWSTDAAYTWVCMICDFLELVAILVTIIYLWQASIQKKIKIPSIVIAQLTLLVL